ncbi:hypothetical protein LTR95_003064 [Oleoguttula sp. CCFEE 5521]
MVNGMANGQGVVVLAFLKVPGNVARLASTTTNIKPLAAAEIDETARTWVLENPNAETPMFTQPCPPSLSRDTGAKMLEIIAASTPEAKVPVYLELDFVKDGLFCEWAYVPDFDREVLEVYRRTQVLVGTLGVNHRGRLDEVERSEVRLAGVWGFAGLPDEGLFVKACQAKADSQIQGDGEASESEQED